MKKLAGYLYIVIGLIEVAADLLHYEPLHYIAKPLLMPVLIVFYVQSLGRPLVRIDYLMIAGWLFSWIGDVVLMLAGRSTLYFLIGLVAFLVTHLFYTGAFTMVRDRSVVPILRRKGWVLLPLLAYLIGLMSVVFPAIGADMRVPIVIYSTVIGTMVTFSLNRYKRVSDSSFALVFGGALVFMFSDSLIAVNKFLCHGTLPMAGFWIMSTYIAGQYLIAKGMLINEDNI